VSKGRAGPDGIRLAGKLGILSSSPLAFNSLGDKEEDDGCSHVELALPGGRDRCGGAVSGYLFATSRPGRDYKKSNKAEEQ